MATQFSFKAFSLRLRSQKRRARRKPTRERRFKRPGVWHHAAPDFRLVPCDDVAREYARSQRRS